MDPVDEKWLLALKLFIGGGHGPVPWFSVPDGTVDAAKTMTNFMSMFNVRPKEENAK